MVRNTKVEKTTVAAAAPVTVASIEVKPAAVEVAKAPKAPRATKATKAAAAPVEEPVVASAPVQDVVPVSAAPVEEPENVSSEARLAALESQLQSINAIFSAVKTTVKDLRKVLSREKKAAEKSSKTKGAKKVNKDRKPSGFTKPTLISDELAKFLGKTAGTEMSRTEAAKEVIAYIQSHKLKDEKNGRIIHPDAALSALLKVTSADNLHFFNLQTFMKPHFIKTVPAATA